MKHNVEVGGFDSTCAHGERRSGGETCQVHFCAIAGGAGHRRSSRGSHRSCRTRGGSTTEACKSHTIGGDVPILGCSECERIEVEMGFAIHQIHVVSGSRKGEAGVRRRAAPTRVVSFLRIRSRPTSESCTEVEHLHIGFLDEESRTVVFSAIPESQLALTVVEGFTIAKLFDIDGGCGCRCEVAALFKFPQVGVARRYFRTYNSIRLITGIALHRCGSHEFSAGSIINLIATGSIAHEAPEVATAIVERAVGQTDMVGRCCLATHLKLIAVDRHRVPPCAVNGLTIRQRSWLKRRHYCPHCRGHTQQQQ